MHRGKKAERSRIRSDVQSVGSSGGELQNVGGVSAKSD